MTFDMKNESTENSIPTIVLCQVSGTHETFSYSACYCHVTDFAIYTSAHACSNRSLETHSTVRE
jgi:hypothetical protein